MRSVDPGVDHLYAIKKIGEVHAEGGKVFCLIYRFDRLRADRPMVQQVKEVYSYCGGLVN